MSLQWTSDPAESRSDIGGFRGGSGSPLLLLHPALTSWRAWRPVLGDLTSHHDVLAMTMTGHRGGPARAPGVPLTISQLVDDAERELDALGLDTVHLSGNSLGARICLELTRRGRARSVVAFSPPGAWVDHTDSRRTVQMVRGLQRIARVPGVLQAVRPKRARHAMLLAGMQHGERVTLADLAAMVRDLAYANVLSELYDDVKATGPMGPLATGVPVRIAWAEHDRVSPYRRFGVPLRPLIPNGEFLILPSVGHVPMWDDPQLTVDTILEVTSTVDAAASPASLPTATSKEAS